MRLVSPYTEIEDPNSQARAAWREAIERARESHRTAYLM